ncbi:hypothetical protein [Fibrella aquatica]|jgi:hypothetical protein|uniref:hypothetical protein n=1 Tax=Fibrella aquatica TaxID=3242487 RepID=UPI0035228170
METTTYLRIDPGELDDVLTKIEQSYSITFGTNDLRQVETFGQLCEAIIEKIQLAEVGDCTSQQAFYKLRQGMVDVLQLDRQTIRPTTELATLFPGRTRRASVQKLENALGFSFNVLTPGPIIIIPVVILLLISGLTLFSSVFYGSIGLIAAIATLVISQKLGNQFALKTIGELAEKLAREHYTKVRREACTVNKRELVDNIKQVFCADLGISPDQLQPDSLF